MKIYVATSWKNPHCTEVVSRLRADGHKVYDFREAGFAWGQVGLPQGDVSVQQLNDALETPLAAEGFKRDMMALEACELCVLVLPSGRSAHIEAGYACGEDKFVIVYSPGPLPAELMYKMTEGVVSSLDELSKMVMIYSY